MYNSETTQCYEQKLEKAIERFKQWCSDNPTDVGKDSCQDCVHLIDPKQYGECSGPPLDRNELCEPGYQQFKLERSFKPGYRQFKLKKEEKKYEKYL